MAERFWPDESPLDRFIKVEAISREPLRIVGVAGDVKHLKLNDAEPRPAIYVPYFQSPDRYMALTVRAAGDPAATARSVREAIQAVDRDQPVYLVKTMQAVVNESLSQPRLYMALLVVFALLALMLAAIGIYGVMSYTVTQRKHEIGVRVALGAQPADILKMVIRQGMILTIIGAVIGISAALTLSLVAANFWPDTISAMLYGVGAPDLTIYIAIPALLSIVALLSISIPATRATRTDPIIALRHE
jgi:putative ABC transport system permease protein